MEYIECTHCGKRYAVNEKIRESVGDFARCKNCFEKFLLVVRDSNEHGIETDTDGEGLNATSGWDPTLTIPPPTVQDEDATEGWDPSLTMPEEEPMQDEGSSVSPPLDDDGMQAKAKETLAAIQKKKKEKIIHYVVLGVVVVLLLMVLYVLFAKEEAVISTQTIAPLKQTVQEKDMENPDCRLAAAQQWLLDYKAMHTSYSGEAFIELLKKSDIQENILKEMCINPRLSREILEAATAKEKPDWFSTEINALQ